MELDTRMWSRRSGTVLSQGFLLAENFPRNLRWTPRKQIVAQKCANWGSRNGSAFLGAPFYVFNRRPRKWVQIAAPKMGPWIHQKIKKNVPRVNKLGPKRAPKVVSGEGEHHLGPEISNNISWPEMGTICMGRDSLTKKTYVNSRGNSGGPS